MISRNPVAKWQTTAHLDVLGNYRFVQAPEPGILAVRVGLPWLRSAPDCQDRYPSPILRPGPCRVRPFFPLPAHATFRAVQIIRFASSRNAVLVALRCKPGHCCPVSRSTTKRGSLTCTNPLPRWPFWSSLPVAMARSIPIARGLVPLRVQPLGQSPTTISQQAPSSAVLAVPLPPIRACAARPNRRTRHQHAETRATRGIPRVALCDSRTADKDRTMALGRNACSARS